MALNANALLTLAQAKEYLKIVGVADDALVEFWINAASDELESETDRKLKQVVVTEYQHGRNGNILQLREWPVQAAPLPQVWVDNAALFPASTEIAPSELRVADSETAVLRVGATFPVGYGNIKVVYTAGYATIPADLQNAALWLVTWYHDMRNNRDIGRPSRGKGGETTTVLQEAPPYVRAAINRYKRCEFPAASLPVVAT